MAQPTDLETMFDLILDNPDITDMEELEERLEDWADCLDEADEVEDGDDWTEGELESMFDLD